MDRKSVLLAPMCGALFLLVGCAASSGSGLVEQRRESFYPRPSEPALEGPEEPSAPEAVGLPTSADLESLVVYGLRHSSKLRTVFEEWLASTERVEQASTLPEPRLTYVEFIEEVQTRTGPQERKLALSQPFPWPGKLDAEARVAQHMAEARWYGVQSERLTVVRDIEVAFYDYGFLGKEIRVTSDLLELLRSLEPVVLSRVRSGAGQEDLLRLQIEIGRLEDDLASVEGRRATLSAKLLEAMNLRGSTEVLPLPALVEPAARPVDPSTLFERALRQSPRIQALRIELRAAREAIELARFRGKPSLALGIEYIQTGDALNPSTPGDGDDPLAVGLTLSLPIWRSSYSSSEREARHRSRASEERIQTAESVLRTEVEESSYRIDEAARRIALFRDSLIPRADEALRLTQAAYRTGASTVLDLIDSERALLEFELSYWRACRDLLQSEARLKALIGELPEEIQ